MKAKIKKYFLGIIVLAMISVSCKHGSKEKGIELMKTFEYELGKIEPSKESNYQLIQEIAKAKTELENSVTKLTDDEKLNADDRKILDSVTNIKVSNKYKELLSIIDTKSQEALKYAENKNWVLSSNIKGKTEYSFTIVDNEFRFLNSKGNYTIKHNQDDNCSEIDGYKVYFAQDDKKLLLINSNYESKEFIESKGLDLIVGTFNGSLMTHNMKIDFSLEVKSNGKCSMPFTAHNKMYGQIFSQKNTAKVKFVAEKDSKYSFESDFRPTSLLFTYNDNSLSGNIGDFGFCKLKRETNSSTKSVSDIFKGESISESSNDNSSDNNVASSDCDQFLKDYEEFADSYIEILKKYKENPSDADVLADYNEIMEKATEMEKSAGNCTDAKYSSKLAKIINKISKAAQNLN